MEEQMGLSGIHRSSIKTCSGGCRRAHLEGAEVAGRSDDADEHAEGLGAAREREAVEVEADGV